MDETSRLIDTLLLFQSSSRSFIL